MDIRLDSEAIREATKTAILNTLTGPEKEKLLQAAVESLLKQGPDGHGSYGSDKRSQIERIFAIAVETAAHEAARKFVAESPDIRDKLEALLRAAALKMVDTDVDKLVERMASAFVSSLKDRY